MYLANRAALVPISVLNLRVGRKEQGIPLDFRVVFLAPAQSAPFEFEDVLIRPWTRHEVAAGRSTKIHVIREHRGITFEGLFGVVGAMDSAQRCRDQAAECLRLVKLAQSKHEAEVLRNISSSWTRLAGQIDRYNALVREQGRTIRK